MKDETILLKSKNQSCSFYPMVLIKIGENYNSLPLPENSIYISDSHDILCLINITFPIQAKHRLGQSQGNWFFFGNSLWYLKFKFLSSYLNLCLGRNDFILVFSKYTFHVLLFKELPEKLQLSGELRPPL